ncbi:MAG: gamma-glutamyl-gamma-aminobutyrate hydrolase family protein [Rhodospirillales bacterium]
MRSLVGISCCVKNFGPNTLANHAASDACVRAVEQCADAVPVLLPALGATADIETLLSRLDGILLTGSRSMVAPVHYGGPPLPDGMKEDGARDATTLPLIRAAVARGMPVLAICRGLQELNVALGGTLHQCLRDVPGRMDHSAPQTDDLALKFAKAHGVRLRLGGMLHRLAECGHVEVNSLHQQGIDRLAGGLVVEAEAADGTIESVCWTAGRGFVLGVQWHPEADFATDPISRRIFEVFGAAVRGTAMREMALAAD